MPTVKHTVTTVTTTSRGGHSSSNLNFLYISTLPGILKIVEIIFGCIAITLATYGTHFRYRPPQIDFFLFVTSFCLIITLFFLLLWILTLYRVLLLPWNSLEFAYHCVATVLYLVSSVCLMINPYRRTFWIIAAILGFVNTVFYFLSLLFSFVDIRRS